MNQIPAKYRSWLVPCLLVAVVVAMVISALFARDDSLIAQFPARRAYLEQLNHLSDAANASGGAPCAPDGPRMSAELRSLLSKEHFFMVCMAQYPGEHLWDVPTGGLAGSGSVGYAFIPPLPNGERVEPPSFSDDGIVYRHIVDNWYAYALP
jgi:hypothetical protein